jgi:hypothetical protein
LSLLLSPLRSSITKVIGHNIIIPVLEEFNRKTRRMLKSPTSSCDSLTIKRKKSVTWKDERTPLPSRKVLEPKQGGSCCYQTDYDRDDDDAESIDIITDLAVLRTPHHEGGSFADDNICSIPIFIALFQETSTSLLSSSNESIFTTTKKRLQNTNLYEDSSSTNPLDQDDNDPPRVRQEVFAAATSCR